MGDACPNATEALLQCVRESKCMQVDKNTFQQCYQLMKKNDPSIEPKCYGLANALYVCRKSQVGVEWKLENELLEFSHFQIDGGVDS